MAPRLLLAVLLAGAWGCAGTVDEAQLAARVTSSHPRWASYQEDIKGQVGARPVAEWEGALESIDASSGLVEVTIRLKAPWAARDAAMPILLEEPVGGVHEATASRREGDRRVYTFAISGTAGSEPAPWVQLKLPRQEPRIVLPPNGHWKAPENG